jgi:DNA-binding CsgD family transcriptional regulator
MKASTALATQQKGPESSAVVSHGETVRELALQLRSLSQHFAPPFGSAADVLLDIELEDFRCIILRKQLEPARAAQTLSPREQEIARMVGEGYPNKVIADVLDISIFTVSTYLRRIFAKLNVTPRAAMVATILEAGNSLRARASGFVR